MESLLLALLTAHLLLAQVQTVHALTLEEYARNEAIRRNIDPDVFVAVLDCESGFEPEIQSHVVVKGKREESYGVAQFHLPSNPNISKKQALDPYFSIATAALEFSKGNANKWSCYRFKYYEHHLPK